MHWQETKLWNTEKDKIIVYSLLCTLAYASLLIDYIASYKEEKMHTLKLIIIILIFLSYSILAFYQYKARFLGGFIVVISGAVLSLALVIHCTYYVYFSPKEKKKENLEE